MYAFNPLLYVLEVLWLPFLYCFGFSVTFSIVLRSISSERRFVDVLLYYFAFTLPISLIGFSAGALAGLSRSPAIGNVLPAVLALLAGLSVYIFGTENRFKIVVGYSVTMFVIMLFLGVQTGAYQREQGREGYLKYLSEQEFRIRAFRKNLGLPEEMPGWITSSDAK
jgi:hypothetical protein